MGKSIEPGYLATALQQELESYSSDVTEKVNAAGSSAVKKLQQLTKASAPVASGSFRKNIATKEQASGPYGMKSFVWYVKAPDHRLTHLIVHGHQTRNGGRTKANPFLRNALDTVLPEYEKEVKEAVKG